MKRHIRRYGGGKMPVPYRFERDAMTECEQCGSELENSGVVVMYKGNPLHLCVECAGKRFEKMMSKMEKGNDRTVV